MLRFCLLLPLLALVAHAQTNEKRLGVPQVLPAPNTGIIPQGVPSPSVPRPTPGGNKIAMIERAKKLIPDLEFLLKALPLRKWAPVKGVIAKDAEGRFRGRIFQYAKKNGGLLFQVRYIINVPIEKLVNLLWNVPHELWNEDITFTQSEPIDETTKLAFTRTKAQGGGIIAPREFVDLYSLKASPDNKVVEIALRSVKGTPSQWTNVVDPSAIRGENLISGYRLRATRNKRFNGPVTELTFISNTDYKLGVHAEIANKLAPLSTLKYVRLMAEYVESQ